MRVRGIACALALGIAVSASPLHANGRFPRAQRLRERIGDPSTLVLAATYGLLVTHDRGGQWRHVCELGYAFSIDELDPLVELAADGALLVTAAHSLNRAPAPYCDFAPALGGPGTETVVDYALDPGTPSRVVAVRMRSDAGDIANELFESRDDGATFAPFGAPLPAGVAFVVTLDLAPSDANRLYLSALGADEPSLFVRSDDGGATFAAFSLPVAAGEYPYIAGIHPTDPDRVYVRTDSTMTDADGIATASDALFVSEDGGRSFREILRAPGKLFGFALSPDGGELVAGYGDPVEPSTVVDPAALGIYRATTTEHAFAKIFEGSVSCLAWTESGLYACTSESERGFALGFALDASFTLADANPLAPLLELGAVAGPLACPAESSGARCDDFWPESCALFDACGSGGSPGAGGEAGTPEPTAPRTNDASGCACRSRGSGVSAAALVPGLLAALALRRRRATTAASRAASARAPARRAAPDTTRIVRARGPS